MKKHWCRSAGVCGQCENRARKIGVEGKGMMMGSMGTGDMKMDKPMKMSGTMTMMGQTYQCNMTMTPQAKSAGKGLSP
jgi:hypothetical protein